MPGRKQWVPIDVPIEGFNPERVIDHRTFAPDGDEWPRVSVVMLIDTSEGRAFPAGVSIVSSWRSSPDAFPSQQSVRIPPECMLEVANMISLGTLHIPLGEPKGFFE